MYREECHAQWKVERNLRWILQLATCSATHSKVITDSRLLPSAQLTTSMKYMAKHTPPFLVEPSPATGQRSSGLADAPHSPSKPARRASGPLGIAIGASIWLSTQLRANLPTVPMVWKHDIIRNAGNTQHIATSSEEDLGVFSISSLPSSYFSSLMEV